MTPFAWTAIDFGMKRATGGLEGVDGMNARAKRRKENKDGKCRRRPSNEKRRPIGKQNTHTERARDKDCGCSCQHPLHHQWTERPQCAFIPFQGKWPLGLSSYSFLSNISSSRSHQLINPSSMDYYSWSVNSLLSWIRNPLVVPHYLFLFLGQRFQFKRKTKGEKLTDISKVVDISPKDVFTLQWRLAWKCRTSKTETCISSNKQSLAQSHILFEHTFLRRVCLFPVSLVEMLFQVFFCATKERQQQYLLFLLRLFCEMSTRTRDLRDDSLLFPSTVIGKLALRTLKGVQVCWRETFWLFAISVMEASGFRFNRWFCERKFRNLMFFYPATISFSFLASTIHPKLRLCGRINL